MAAQYTKEGRSEGVGTLKWRTKCRELEQDQEADNRMLAGRAVAAQQTTKIMRNGNMHTENRNQGRGGSGRGGKPTPGAMWRDSSSTTHQVEQEGDGSGVHTENRGQ